MKLWNWFKALSSGRPQEQAALLKDLDHSHCQCGEAVHNGLDFLEAIRAHNAWKIKLKKAIADGTISQFDAAEIRRDDRCFLGRWLYSEGLEHYGDEAVLQTIIDVHRQFHQCAAEVVDTAQGGQLNRAAALLESGEYAQYSVDISALLGKLYLRFSQRDANHSPSAALN
ncbi:MAG: CZB domain-containing protein [Candidatus Competibacterales bacterium]